MMSVGIKLNTLLWCVGGLREIETLEKLIEAKVELSVTKVSDYSRII